MSRAWWQVLGIAADGDRAAIRRAYARRLRETHPEDDPEGFKALRAAYEHALMVVDARERGVVDDDDEWCEDRDGESLTVSAVTLPIEPHIVIKPAAPEVEPPKADPLQVERDEEQAAFQAAMNALGQQLSAPWRDDHAAERLFADVLSSPAMGEIAIRGHAEEWLAQLIAGNQPQSDAILLQAVEAFGWNEDAVFTRRSLAVDAVLARLDEWRVIDRFRRDGGSDGMAWRMLEAPPRRMQWLQRLQAAVAMIPVTNVRSLIELGDWQMRGITTSWNTDTVNWWRDYLSRPHLSLWTLALALLVWGMTIVAIAQFPTAPGSVKAGLTVLGGLIGFATPWIYMRTVARTCHASQNDPAHDPPWWQPWGWTILIALLPAGALLVPPGPEWSVAFMVLCALTAIWAGGTAPAHRLELPEGTELILALVVSLALLVTGGILLDVIDGSRALILLSLTAAATVVRVAAAGRLTHVMAVRGAQLKVPWLIGMVLVTALALLAPATPDGFKAGVWGIAMMLIVALAHPASAWLRNGIRVAVMVVFVAVVPAPAPSPQPPAAPNGETITLEQAATRQPFELTLTLPDWRRVAADKPDFYAKVQAVVADANAGRIVAAEGNRQIADLVDRAYAEAKPRLTDTQLVERLRLMLTYKKRADDPLACSSGRSPLTGRLPTGYSDTLAGHMLRSIAADDPGRVPPAAGGQVVYEAELFPLAARRLEIHPAELTDMAASDAPAADLCRAQIAIMEELLTRPPGDVAATLRQRAVNAVND